MDKVFLVGLFLMGSLCAFVAGMQMSRDFMFKEATRCLEAPDMDTARVCWDAATLGWKP